MTTECSFCGDPARFTLDADERVCYDCQQRAQRLAVEIRRNAVLHDLTVLQATLLKAAHTPYRDRWLVDLSSRIERCRGAISSPPLQVDPPRKKSGALKLRRR